MNRVKNYVQIALVICLIFLSNSVGANSSFVVEADFGFGQSYSTGYELPARISIMNTATDFTGEMAIISRINDYDGKTLLFSKNITLKKGIPLEMDAKFVKYVMDDRVTLRLTDLENKIVYEKEFRLKFLGTEKRVGVISDLQDYGKRINSFFGSQEVAWIKRENLKLATEQPFSMLILGPLEGTLTNEDKENIKKWLGLKESILVVDAEQKSALEELKVDEKKVIVLEKNLLNTLESQELIREKYNEIKASNVAENDKYYYSESYLERVPYEAAPNIEMLKFLLIAFVILVGPVSYLVLKKLDMKEWIWVTTLGFVLIFSYVVYYVTSAGASNGPLVSRTNYIHLNQEADHIESKLFVFGTRDKIVEVKGEPALNFDMKTLSWRSYREDKEGTVAKMDYEANVFKYLNLGFWNQQRINTNIKQELGDLVSQLTIKNNHLIGEIKNTTANTIEDGVLVYGSSLFFIGDIKSGETLKVDKALSKMPESYFMDLGYILDTKERKDYLESIGKLELYTDNYRAMSDGIKAAILSTIPYEERLDSVKFLGWNQSEINKPIKINGADANYINRNVFIKEIPMSFKKGMEVALAYNDLDYTVLNSNGITVDQYANNIFNKGFIELEYKVDKDIKTVNKFSIEAYDEENLEYKDYFAEKMIEVFIYNRQTNDWEKVERTIDVDKDQLASYMENGNVRLKIKLNDYINYSLPQFYVKGVFN